MDGEPGFQEDIGESVSHHQTVAELGEQRLLALLQSYGDPEAIGDDAAVLPIASGHSLVVTTDVLVEDVHFSDRTTPPHSVGWRAAAANLSDLAAMGATGIGITVALSLPPDCPVAWIQQVYQGIKDCLHPYRLSIVGGDVSNSRIRSLAITALGQVSPGHQIRRDCACPGDAIVVTGSHGGSRAGLELLLDTDQSLLLGEAWRSQLIQLHQYPSPRLDCVTCLNRLHQADVLTDLEIHIAGMDSSDGLADAVLQLCRASGTGAVIQGEKIPIPEALHHWQTPQRAMEWALYGGEDFELVLCMPPQAAQHFCAAWPAATIVGFVTVEPSVYVDCSNAAVSTGAEGNLPDLLLTLDRGFQHFKP